jgi:D-Tyr-tRNA(Tyr) deacylase
MKGGRRSAQNKVSLLSQPAILQRVASASVTVDKQLVSSIGRGILVFAAIGANDTNKDVESMASKVLRMKMWPDEAGSGVRQTNAFIGRGLIPAAMEAERARHCRRNTLR